eukprot:5518318-Pyramimonas_sp.AAC.1
MYRKCPMHFVREDRARQRKPRHCRARQGKSRIGKARQSGAGRRAKYDRPGPYEERHGKAAGTPGSRSEGP